MTPVTPEEEERGWDAVREHWTDDEAHRAWLAAFTDLEGLARAGQRYRAHLADHPGDAVAARWRDEIVKRATVHGLASLPRTRPAPQLPRWLKGLGIAVLGLALSVALYWIARELLTFARAR
jgi:hypothetical protein